jgi:LPXTG-motif cell wall-anchored protein
MAATADATCTEAHGTAAPFVTSIDVDGHTITQAEVTGQPVPATGGEWWSWSVQLEVHGERTVTVTDTQANGETFTVGVFNLSCSNLESTTTIPSFTSETVEPVATIEPSTSVVLDLPPVPQLVLDVTTTVVTPSTEWGPCFDDGTCLPTTTAVVVQTPTENTLPATGSSSGPLVLAGATFLLVGLAAVAVARRRPCPA